MRRHRSWTLLLLPLAGAASCGNAVLDPFQQLPPPLSTSDGAVTPTSDGAVTPTPDGAVPINETGLLAHWTFDEGMGTQVHDSAAVPHDGALMGTTWAWAVDGRFGHGLTLKRGDHVTVPNFPQATANWTVSLWVRFAINDLATGRAPLIGNEMNNGGWEVNTPGDVNPPPANLEFAYPTAAGGGFGGNVNHIHVSCCAPPPIDTWLHITAVLDNSPKANTLSMYLGDALQMATGRTPLIQPGSLTLTMGTANVGQFQSQFQGTIDEIRIYGRALTQAEISLLNTMP